MLSRARVLVDIFAVVCAWFPMTDNRLQPARQRQLMGSDRADDAGRFQATELAVEIKSGSD
jgi:hypothetical protein